MADKSGTYCNVTIIENEHGFYVPLLERTFSSLTDACKAIDAHLAKPKEIVIETVDQAAAEASDQDNGIPLPEPKPVRRSGRRM